MFVCMHVHTAVGDQAIQTISTEDGQLLAIFSAREMTQMSFKAQTSDSLLFHFHVHLAKVRLPTPKATESFLT